MDPEGRGASQVFHVNDVVPLERVNIPIERNELMIFVFELSDRLDRDAKDLIMLELKFFHFGLLL